MQVNVLTAFDALREAMNGEKVQVADAMREATLNRRFNDAQWFLNKTKRIEQLMDEVRRLREAWERLDETEASYVAEAKPDHAKVETAPVDDEDAPELEVVEQLFGGRRRRKWQRRQAVTETPKRAYRVPILEALEQLGGGGLAGDVLAIVYEKMNDRLMHDELERIPSGGSIRWEKKANWERYRMVQEGLLRSDSPRGVWEMTEAGWAYLERMRREGGAH